jgi:hypothetical protein
MIISVLEIALLIMLPLVLFYHRSIWTYKEYLPSILVIYFIWYLSYALFHELMHLLGAWIFDKTIYEIKLIPRFWTGDLGSGYVKYDYKGDSIDFIIIFLPYARDMNLLPLGESSSKSISHLIGISFFVTSALLTIHIIKR